MSGHYAEFRPIHGILLVALGAIWGASFLFMRIASPEFGPLALIFVRLLTASLMLLAMVAVTGELRSLWQQPLRFTVLGLTNSAIPFTLFAFATLSLSAGFASILNATAPFFGALISVVFVRERLGKLQLVGLTIGFLGVCALVWDKLTWGGHGISIAAGLVAALLYGIAAHYSKRRLGHLSPLVVATGSQIMATVCMAPAAIAFWPATVPGSSAWWAALVLGGLCTGVALAVYFPLLHSIGPTQTMSVAYLIPLFGVLWGILFLQEQLTGSMMAGGLLVLTGLACIAQAQRKPSASHRIHELGLEPGLGPSIDAALLVPPMENQRHIHSVERMAPDASITVLVEPLRGSTLPVPGAGSGSQNAPR